MKATFYELKWNKGSRQLVQGIKGGRRPYNAIAGGNGSFICSNAAELILSVKADDGSLVERNIISVVRGVNGWGKITQNRYEMVEKALKDVKSFELDDDNYIVDLAKYVAV